MGHPSYMPVILLNAASYGGNIELSGTFAADLLTFPGA